MQNIVITGGSGTIGGAIAEKFYEAGYSVWNLDINSPKTDNHIKYVNCDVTDYTKVKDVMCQIKREGKIDALVTVAGGALSSEWANFENTDVKTIENSISLNLLGHINTVHAALPFMRSEDGSSSVTLISSINGMAAYRLAGYSASKAGLEGFMYGISKELGLKGIRINMVSPGTVVTELTLREKDKDWDSLKKETIIDSFTTPEDIADAVFMIANNKSIASQNIVVDSGQLVKK